MKYLIVIMYCTVREIVITRISCSSLMDQAGSLNPQHIFWGQLASVAFVHRPAQAGRSRHLKVGRRWMVHQCRHTSGLLCSRRIGRCSGCKQPSIWALLSCNHNCWYNLFCSCRKSCLAGVEELVVASSIEEWGLVYSASNPNRGDSFQLLAISVPETKPTTKLRTITLQQYE